MSLVALLLLSIVRTIEISPGETRRLACPIAKTTRVVFPEGGQAVQLSAAAVMTNEVRVVARKPRLIIEVTPSSTTPKGAAAWKVRLSTATETLTLIIEPSEGGASTETRLEFSTAAPRETKDNVARSTPPSQVSLPAPKPTLAPVPSAASTTIPPQLPSPAPTPIPAPSPLAMPISRPPTPSSSVDTPVGRIAELAPTPSPTAVVRPGPTLSIPSPSANRVIKLREEFPSPGRRSVYVDRIERRDGVVYIYLSVWWANKSVSVSGMTVDGATVTVRELGRQRNLDLVAQLPATDLRPRNGEVTLLENGRSRTVRVDLDGGGLEKWFIKGRKKW